MKSANDILAENLTRLLAERGLNQSSLAKVAKVAPNTVKNYCQRGRGGSAKLSDVEKIAGALKVPLVSLLTEHSQGEAMLPVIADGQQQLLLDLDVLPVPRQAQLMDMVHIEAEHARAVLAHNEDKRTRQTTSTAAASQSSHVRTSMSVKYGDGNVMQAALPLVVASNPFDPDAASPKEKAWYAQLEKKPPK